VENIIYNVISGLIIFCITGAFGFLIKLRKDIKRLEEALTNLNKETKKEFQDMGSHLGCIKAKLAQYTGDYSDIKEGTIDILKRI
jgi:hypothetical protein